MTELIAPGRIDWDTEFEDPKTGLWWVDMDCVDCLRVANAQRWSLRQEKLEAMLDWLALHPEAVPDSDIETLLGTLHEWQRAWRVTNRAQPPQNTQ